MSIACDFCGKLAERHEETIFIAAPSGLAHICEDCVELSRQVLAVKKAEREDECAGAAG